MKELTIKMAGILGDPLALSRSVKKPVAYLGFDFPLDIVCTENRYFCHLPWQTGMSTPNADRWLESAFPGWAYSILEAWISGDFDHFSCVVFMRSDDAVQRLYYYICELRQRGIVGGPPPFILDVALIQRETSVRHCKHSLGKLLAELGIVDEELRLGITRANQLRKLYVQLEKSRAAPGHIFENISRASLFCDLYEDLSDAQLPVSASSRRLLIAGSAPPDASFYLAVESAGWNVCSEINQRSLLRHGPELEDFTDGPLAALALQLNQSAYGQRCFTDQTARLLSEVKRVNAQAVVLWLTEEDEALAWHVARQRSALQSANIPALFLTRRHWDGSDGAAEEIMNFLEKLEA